jgi:hypothetical protein
MKTMLDFSKLMQQISAIGREALDDRACAPEIMKEAMRIYGLASQQSFQLNDRLKANAPYVLWPVSVPLESFGSTFPVNPNKENLTVVAVDGSQIMPSSHEIHNCFLLNIGLVSLSYGTDTPCVLESFPHLYHRRQDLYPLVDRRRFHIDELYVSLERDLLELSYLADYGAKAKSGGQNVVAMVDGSLIPWSIERMPESYQKRYLEKYASLAHVFRDQAVPMIGYISHSRSSEIVNDLRVALCPYEVSDCRRHCGQLNEEDFPCSKIWPLLDRTLLAQKVKAGERSGAFLSGAGAANLLSGELQVCFVYLNIKEEIARIEFPRWLLNEKRMFDTAIGAVLEQARKGAGYPIGLAEAHHLAVIKGADRKQFFEMIMRQLVAVGAQQVSVSPKEKKKRIGLV